MRPWGGADHSPPSSAEVKEGVQLYLYSPPGPSWCYRAQFTAYFIIYVIGYTCDEVSVFRCNNMHTFTYPLTWRQINTVSAWLPQPHLNNTRTCTYVFRYTLPGTEECSWDTRYSCLPSTSLYVAVCHQYAQLFASPWTAVCSPVLQQCYATSGPRVFQLNLHFPIPEGNFFQRF